MTPVEMVTKRHRLKGLKGVNKMSEQENNKKPRGFFAIGIDHGKEELVGKEY